jgi:putative membrane protein (TIGR04086 family)
LVLEGTVSAYPSGVNAKAIFLGALTALFLSFFLAFFLGWLSLRTPYSLEDWGWFLVLPGLASLAAGAFFAGRLAGRRVVVHGILASVLATAFALAITPGELSWVPVAGAVAAGAVGGALAASY